MLKRLFKTDSFSDIEAIYCTDILEEMAKYRPSALCCKACRNLSDLWRSMCHVVSAHTHAYYSPQSRVVNLFLILYCSGSEQDLTCIV